MHKDTGGKKVRNKVVPLTILSPGRKKARDHLTYSLPLPSNPYLCR